MYIAPIYGDEWGWFINVYYRYTNTNSPWVSSRCPACGTPMAHRMQVRELVALRAKVLELETEALDAPATRWNWNYYRIYKYMMIIYVYIIYIYI